MARVRAVLRRVRGGVHQPGLVRVGDLEIDLHGHRVTRAGKPVRLTRIEFNLLATLAQHPGQTFTRAQLLDRLHGVAWDGFDRSIDAHHPPWAPWDHDHEFPRWPPAWQRKRGLLFLRFAGAFGFMALLVLGGMAALSFLLTRLFGGGEQAAVLVWFGGCGLSLALPLLAVVLAVRVFRGIATPIARQLVQAHGGWIEAQSELGRGTTFTIELPAS